MTTSFTFTFDCADPQRLAAFWKDALGYVDAPPPTGFATWEEWFVACDVPEDERGDGAALVDPEGALPRLSFLKVPEPKTAKNRLHLDLQVAGGRAVPQDERWPRIEATVERLLAAGGSVVASYAPDHVVMADPEGNELCVV